MIYRGQGFLAVVLVGSSPPPPPPTASYLSFSDFLCVAGRSNLLTEEGEGGGRGAKSFDREKAWSSINLSILSGAEYIRFYSRTMQ